MSRIYAYLFDNMDDLQEDFVIQNIHRLPAFRQNQCAKYRRMADKNACVLAYLLLAEGLDEVFGVTRPPEFLFNQYGKPYLRDTPQVFFSLSHCRRGIVCVLADFEIGADIQDIRPFDIDIARKVCSDDELPQLSESDNPSKLFCRIWTEKESFAKTGGISVANLLRLNMPNNGFIYRYGDDYCITVYCRENQPYVHWAYRERI